MSYSALSAFEYNEYLCYGSTTAIRYIFNRTARGSTLNAEVDPRADRVKS